MTSKLKRKHEFNRQRLLAKRIACHLAGGHKGNPRERKARMWMSGGQIWITKTHCLNCGTWLDSPPDDWVWRSG